VKFIRVLLPVLMVVISLRCTWAADLSALVDDLANEAKRKTAIDEILKQGAEAETVLKKIEVEKKLEERQLTLVRRLIGNTLINSTTLKPIDLSKLAPFGADKEKNIPGDPTILIDPDPETRKQNKTIVLNGEFALEQGPLEYLVVSKGPNAKLHETVLAVDARPHDICYALLACEYGYAGELGDDGIVNLPKDAGVMMSVEFEWETPNIHTGEAEPEGTVDGGKEQPAATATPNPNKHLVRVPLEFFAFNLQTEKPMKRVPFAFTGSRFDKDPQTGKSIFVADFEKSIVAVRLDPTAILNSPLNTRNINPLHANGYSVNWHVVPKRHTKCRLILEPYTGKELTNDDFNDTGDKKGEGVKTEWAH
jgi:hypothetical protein